MPVHLSSGGSLSKLPRCAIRHKLGIQKYKGRAGRQIATLFERAAWFERSLGKVAALGRIDWSGRNAWTERSLSCDVRHPTRCALVPDPVNENLLF